ncbi:unnamed protein product [Caenorhabditis auriculariae]|uniref:Uncharacterized protein n=1 Tax=Caenorhabditis auriculariae TaxID=2777116 RepID=A0A8S1GTE4_9PELO|nr:unnamed protein product [Caenorhabditis auriculariae]
MGCTHSKNAKTQSKRQMLERPIDPAFAQKDVRHASANVSSTSTDSSPNENYHQLPKTTKQSLPEKPAVGVTDDNHPKISATAGLRDETNQRPTQTADPRQRDKVIGGTSDYCGMPPMAPRQLEEPKEAPPPYGSGKKLKEREHKRKKERERKPDKEDYAPLYRPHLSAEDMECIRRSVQQRNERRAYMLQHRDETDDTLYELDCRMPERDYSRQLGNVQPAR